MSSKSSSSSTKFSTDLAREYECPVCMEYMMPPILQCSNGHAVCSNCNPKLNCCPTCKGSLGTIRNLFMEKFLSYVHFPCKFSAQGCQVTMLLADKSDHEENCELGPQCCCPCFTCGWQGRPSQMLSHIDNKHVKTDKIQGDNDTILLDTEDVQYAGDGNWATLLDSHGHHFFFILDKRETKTSDGRRHDRFWAAVQMLGTRDQARKFSYKLKLKGDRYGLSWEATPLCRFDTLESAAQDDECFVFKGIDSAHPFPHSGELTLDLKIKKKWIL